MISRLLLASLAFPLPAFRQSQGSAHVEAQACEALKVNGYKERCGVSCGARSISSNINRAAGVETAELCGKACSAHENCNCFSLTSKGRCRIGLTSVTEVRRLPGSTAYVRDTSSESAALACTRGEVLPVEGNCSSYRQCVASEWEVAECPVGMAFCLQRRACAWSGVVDGCQELASKDDVRNVHCGTAARNARTYLLARGEAVQSWIRHEVEKWQAEASKRKDVRTRPEGAAAVSILRTVMIEMSGIEGPSRWAVFSQGKDGGLDMQAVALVNQQNNTMDIMAVVNRRTLLKDSIAISGAGKALLGGIVDTVHAEAPEKPLIIQGTPGDDEVERMYRRNGMKEVGRSQETGKPLLEMELEPGCVDFFKKSICGELGLDQKSTVAWRLIPQTEKLWKTCAHMMPATAYWDQLAKQREQVLRSLGLLKRKSPAEKAKKK